MAVAKFDYNRAIATANRLIERFGQPGEIVRLTASGPAWDPQALPTAYPCTVCMMNHSDAHMAGGLAQVGDRLVYVAVQGLPIKPTIADRMLVNGVDYEIIEVKPLDPAGIDVYYEINARC